MFFCFVFLVLRSPYFLLKFFRRVGKFFGVCVHLKNVGVKKCYAIWAERKRKLS